MATIRRTAALRALWEALSGARQPGSPGVGERLAVTPRMVSEAWRGTYPGLARSRLGLMALALAYIVSPADLVPESVFLLLGLGDDAVVLAWLAGALLSDTEAYLRWSDQRSRTVPGRLR